MEIAESEGKATGIVNDHDITNATLAAFAAPIVNRDWKVAIAQRTLRGISPDVMMGGGEGYWYPRGDEGMIPNKVPDEDPIPSAEVSSTVVRTAVRHRVRHPVEDVLLDRRPRRSLDLHDATDATHLSRHASRGCPLERHPFGQTSDAPSSHSARAVGRRSDESSDDYSNEGR